MTDPIHEVQVEFVRGCNLKCQFCGSYSLPEAKAYMPLDVALKLATQISALKENGRLRIAFSMRGEPTLHKSWAQYVALFRKFNPRAQLTMITNGTKLNGLEVMRFFKAGGNILLVDCYENSWGVLHNRLMGLESRGVEYYDTDYSSWTYHGYKQHVIRYMRPPGWKGEEGCDATRVLSNQCGAIWDGAYDLFGIKRLKELGASPGKGLALQCTNPFREISVCWNGDIPMCCRDWKGELILGNIMEIDDLLDFWENNHTLQRVRTFLFNKRRDFVPCCKCNWSGGFRKGLLPKMPRLKEGVQF